MKQPDEIKLVYMIHAHKNPVHLQRLVRRLSTERSIFYIHIDRRVDIQPFRRRLEEFDSEITYIKREKSYWASYGQTKAIMNGINQLVEDGMDYDYAVLLSGQDYPIQTNKEIESFFNKHNGISFVHLHDGIRPQDSLYHFKLLGRSIHFPAHQRGKGKTNTVFYMVGRIVSPFVKPRKYNYDIKMYWGYTWWCLTKEAVEYIYSFLKRRTDILKYFKYQLGSDEELFHTILYNSDMTDRIQPRCLIWQDWERPKKAPYIFKKEDYDFIAGLSDHLFARKFDMDIDSEILDMIDGGLLGIESKTWNISEYSRRE